MKVASYAQVNGLRVVVSQAPIGESDEEKPGVVLNYVVGG